MSNPLLNLINNALNELGIEAKLVKADDSTKCYYLTGPDVEYARVQLPRAKPEPEEIAVKESPRPCTCGSDPIVVKLRARGA